MGRLIDLSGMKVGRWLVLERAEDRGGTRWLCRCECGNEASVPARSLRDGTSQSCGCVRNASNAQRTRDHHSNWSGGSITYRGAHRRMQRWKGAATSHTCIDCGTQAEHWSYVGQCPDETTGMNSGYLMRYCPSGHEACYVPRCPSCHTKYDQEFPTGNI